jgi:hypothetical protein
MAVTPIAASSTTGNNTTTTTTTTTATSPPPLEIELSPQPIWEEQVSTTGVTQINETHSIVDFDGNGTMTVPDTGQTIPMTNNGTAIISPLPGAGADTIGAYGRESVFSQDDNDTTAITFYEIVQYQPEPFQGKGTIIGVFDTNATGSLAPFNGMMIVGTHDENPNTQAATITLWEWQSGIPFPPATTSTESPPLTNTTTAIAPNATNADESNVTATAGPPEEEVVEEQQQQATPTAPAPLLE